MEYYRNTNIKYIKIYSQIQMYEIIQSHVFPFQFKGKFYVLKTDIFFESCRQLMTFKKLKLPMTHVLMKLCDALKHYSWIVGKSYLEKCYIQSKSGKCEDKKEVNSNAHRIKIGNKVNYP